MVMENPSERAEEVRNSVADRMRQTWLSECELTLEETRGKLYAATEPMAIAVAIWPRGEKSAYPITPPIPMLLWCPECGARHVDKGEFATTKHHHTHACQSCGHCWRPAIVATVGVQFLPGFKDE